MPKVNKEVAPQEAEEKSGKYQSDKRKLKQMQKEQMQMEKLEKLKIQIPKMSNYPVQNHMRRMQFMVGQLWGTNWSEFANPYL